MEEFTLAATIIGYLTIGALVVAALVGIIYAIGETTKAVDASQKHANRIDKIEGRLDKIEGRLDKIEGRLDKLEYKSPEAYRSTPTLGGFGGYAVPSVSVMSASAPITTAKDVCACGAGTFGRGKPCKRRPKK